MNAQHTPGPWRVVSDPSHYDTLSTVRSSEAADNWPHWRMILQVGGAAGPQEQEATTRLIAAAPDLLEALAEMYALAMGPAGGVTRQQKVAALAKSRAALVAACAV